MINFLSQINTYLNNLVWGIPALTLLIGTGVVLTLFTKGFQFTHFFYGIGVMFSGKSDTHKEDTPKASTCTKASHSQGSLSQYQAFCTALSGTLGTGNISGMAYAIVLGGPGAVFWMWIAALFGMITSFAEKVLGIYYRHRNAKGEWCGGAMYYLRDGLGCKKGCKTLGKLLAALFSLFTILASFGIGNLGQVASIRESVLSFGSFTGNIRLDAFLIGVCIALLSAFIILGGLSRIAKANEALVPFMAGMYILGTLFILALHAEKLLPALGSIFKHAFSTQAAAGGIGGALIKQAITQGFQRGVFSNEAGMGSSVIVHAASDVSEPVVQGFWGSFEVFFDTIVICTLTALLILTSGVIDLNTGLPLTQSSSFALATTAFTNAFGLPGGLFMTLAMALFALATILGWSYYGVKAWEYLFGTQTTRLYLYIYIAVILLGCTLKVDLIVALSDTFNGLMVIPNLIGVLGLSGTFLEILENYKRRVLRGEKGIVPMVSCFEERL